MNKKKTFDIEHISPFHPICNLLILYFFLFREDYLTEGEARIDHIA